MYSRQLCVALLFKHKNISCCCRFAFLFYPNKLKFILWCAVFTVLTFLIPLCILYQKSIIFPAIQNWVKAVTEDASDKFIANSPSLIGINYTWLARPLNHFYIQLTGLILLFIPLYKTIKKETDTGFILLYLSFLMLFVVIFNHATESPTYIIATAGAAIWYAVSAKSTFNNILLILLIFGCILVPTDLYPAFIKNELLNSL